MKVLIINGSPHHEGTTFTALKEMINIFESEGIEVDLFQLGAQNIRGCIDCGKCYQTGQCVFDDVVKDLSKRFQEADGLVVGSPVYYASANGTLIALLDRLFHTARFNKTMKVGAAVCAARRGGITTTFDELNKYFTICGMPVASGQYWNGIHGSNGKEAYEDLEGLQQMRTLARNMVFLMRSIELGKEKYGLPFKEKGVATNFIR